VLDLRYIRENPDEIRRNLEERHVDVDLDAVLALIEERSTLIQEVEALRRRQNELAGRMKGKMSPEQRQPLVEEGRTLKTRVAGLDDRVAEVETRLDELAGQIPNRTHPDAPRGRTEEENREIRRWGRPRDFDFTPLDHVALGKHLDLIDFENAARVTGQNFYYLKNEAVLLETGMVRFALDLLRREGFTLFSTPDLARPEIVDGIGFNPRGEETQVYSLANADLCLIGTAEITLGGYLSDRILAERDLPILLGGVSHCFRTEAGAYGRASRGLYRVHQFTKVEMFAFTRPGESEAMHERLVALEEKIFQALEVPYRVMDICTGDLGGPAYRKYDLEAWMPGRGDGGAWGEVTSASNCTDYQARRLRITYRPAEGGKPRPVHMLNGTALAVSRGLIALLENHQEADGSVVVPEALRSATGLVCIEPRRPDRDS
jgi:seryl-tRNA synthetase